MPNPVRHVVLTRFAIKVAILDGVSTKPRSPVPLSPEWLEGRFALFERYLLPSMLAQTFTDWTWRLFVHPDFDAALAERLRAYDVRIEVVTVPTSPVMGVDGIVASTRIDSDDGFASTALDVVDRYAQRFAASDERARLLRLREGWWTDHHRGGTYQHRGWSFLTLFERQAPYRGALAYSCDDIAKRYPEWTEKSPLWLRVVHGGNVRNRIDPDRAVVSLETLRAKGFAWLPAAPPAAVELPAPVVPELPRVALTMRTTRRSGKNYVKRTVAALLAQGVSGLRLQCSKIADASWLRQELGPLADKVTIQPTDRDLSPNATALAGLASIDLASAEWVLLLEDDLTFCRDFVPSVQRWLARYGRSDRNLFRFWGFHRPKNQKVGAFDHPLDRTMAASQAIALRREDAADFLAWATANLQTWRLPGKADPGVAFDKLVASWALTRWPGRPAVLSWPFFVDHIGHESSIHRRGGMNPVGFAGPAWSYREASA